MQGGMSMRTRYWRSACVLLLVLAWSGCIGGDQHVILAPPARPAAAEKWWQETVDTSAPSLLRVLADVSEVHKQNGTSAIYVWYIPGGRTMAGWYSSELRLPVPLPESAVERIKLRLAREGFDEQAPELERPTFAEG